MTRTEKLLEFYERVLNGVDCNITEDAFVQFKNGEILTPITVEEKRLALPTQSILSKLSEGHIVAFHPMCENIILGQSPVIASLRNLTVESLTLKIASTILGIVMSIADKQELTATQIKLIKDFDNVDEKTVKAMTRLVNAINPSEENRLINVYLKHGGIVRDVQYKRVATVTFPLYAEVLEAKDSVFGVKMRKQDIRLLKKILENLFPGIDEKDTYTFGTNSLVCPYFHAILNAFGVVVRQLNKVSYPFKKLIREYTNVEPYVKLDYIENFEEGAGFKDILPPLEYNQGTTNQAQPRTPAAEPIPAPAEVINTPQAAPQPQPAAQPQPQPAPPAPQPQQGYQMGTSYSHPGYGQPQPVHTKPSYLSGIKKIGAEDGPVINKNIQSAPQGLSGEDLSQKMYPPELFPQMQPQPQQQMPTANYPKFSSSGGLVNAAPSQQQAQAYYDPYGNPIPMPVQQFQQQGQPVPQPYPQQGYQGQPYPAQAYPQAYGMQPQPVAQPYPQQGYPPQPYPVQGYNGYRN